ncbi:MAG: SRPBCC domain-containing protein [Halobacteriota archaeon]
MANKRRRFIWEKIIGRGAERRFNFYFLALEQENFTLGNLTPGTYKAALRLTRKKIGTRIETIVLEFNVLEKVYGDFINRDGIATFLTSIGALESRLRILPRKKLLRGGMKQIRAEIEINASAERVWHVLTDFAAFPQWNPFIRQISGELKVGGTLDVYLQPSGQRGMRFRPVVLAVAPSQELRWLGRLWGIPKLFDGEHSLTIEPFDVNRVRFVQQEVFSGILVALLGSTMSAAERSFREMNEALKTLAEKST